MHSTRGRSSDSLAYISRDPSRSFRSSWVTSLGLTFAYIQTQPLSFAQKLVQARVWAQGLTVASLVGMAAITQIPSAGDKIIQQHNDAAEHSWRDFVGDTESDEDVSYRRSRALGRRCALRVCLLAMSTMTDEFSRAIFLCAGCQASAAEAEGPKTVGINRQTIARVRSCSLPPRSKMLCRARVRKSF